MVFLMKTLLFEHKVRLHKGLSTLNNHKNKIYETFVFQYRSNH